MQVHINGESSVIMAAPGGAPQGSVLGCFLFCNTTDNLAQNNKGDVTPPFEGNGSLVDTSIEETDNHIENILSPIAPPRAKFLENKVFHYFTKERGAGDIPQVLD